MMGRDGGRHYLRQEEEPQNKTISMVVVALRLFVVTQPSHP